MKYLPSLEAKEILAEEPNVLLLRSPTTICGNVSGQFGDLLEIFRLVGKPPVDLPIL